MQVLENSLFFDTLNAISIKVLLHVFIQSRMHNLIISSSSKETIFQNLHYSGCGQRAAVACRLFMKYSSLLSTVPG